MKTITICTDCELRTTDGCGPGPVMVCGHPKFKGAHNYEDAIIQWIDIGCRREACSYKCPLIINTEIIDSMVAALLDDEESDGEEN